MLRLQNILFVLLVAAVVGLLAWATERHRYEFDMTWGKRNSLTPPSVALIKQLDEPLEITVFARDNNKTVRDLATDLVGRYRRHKPDIELKLINPDLAPQLAREHGIDAEGELLVRYGQREQTLQNMSEAALTELLSRLANSAERVIAFVEGHGERSLLGDANYDLGAFGEQLRRRGFRLRPVGLARDGLDAEAIAVLVVASPRIAYLPGELDIVKRYLDNGGNLMALLDPETDGALTPLLAALGVARLPGVVVDATTRVLGIADPTFALAVDYPPHAITESLHSQTLFPGAGGLDASAAEAWLATPIIKTLPRSWTETGEIKDQVSFDADTAERAGPIDIGLALQRPFASEGAGENDGVAQVAARTQRAVIIGDGDFLSNNYLGNGQNLDLGLNIAQWLADDGAQIKLAAVGAPDTRLSISRAGAIALLAVFVGLLPLGLLATGAWLWLKRRKA